MPVPKMTPLPTEETPAPRVAGKAMARRKQREVPPGPRAIHGLAPEEFTEYPDDDDRVDPLECGHPVFLDHVFPHTGICLECGFEIVLGAWTFAEAPVTATDGDVAYVPERRVLDDDELRAQRTRWHAIWGMDGWTHPHPDLDRAAPPVRLKGRKVPGAVPARGTFQRHVRPVPQRPDPA